MSDERVTIYTAQDAPHCPECGAALVLVKARAGGRTWPALCCKRCEYWRTYRGPDSLKTGYGPGAKRGRK